MIGHWLIWNFLLYLTDVQEVFALDQEAIASNHCYAGKSRHFLKFDGWVFSQTLTGPSNKNQSFDWIWILSSSNPTIAFGNSWDLPSWNSITQIGCRRAQIFYICKALKFKFPLIAIIIPEIGNESMILMVHVFPIEPYGACSH